VNALKKAKELEEKQARAVTRQLVVDLKKANPTAKKSLIAHAKLVGTTLKMNVSTMLKARKAPVKARLPLKSPAKCPAKALIKKVIVLGVTSASASNHTIRLL
jgi:hypothetical protein